MRYTVYAYIEGKLSLTESFDNKQAAFNFADSLLELYEVVEVIDNDMEEKIY